MDRVPEWDRDEMAGRVARCGTAWHDVAQPAWWSFQVSRGVHGDWVSDGHPVGLCSSYHRSKESLEGGKLFREDARLLRLVSRRN